MRKMSNEMTAFSETDDFKEQLVSKKLNVKDNDRIVQIRRYKLITPLFGGGVEPKKADPIKVIRETSIRGQLRFWWRAMRGVGTLQEMKKREDALFGSGGEKAAQSKVCIVVSIIRKGDEEELFRLDGNRLKPSGKWGKIAYAAFALQPTSEEMKANRNPSMKKVRTGVEFTMTISYPKEITIKNYNAKDELKLDVEKELNATLWAWETFGGLGGRTRRGFGAIYFDTPNLPKTGEIEQSIRTNLKNYLAEGQWHEDIPHLSENVTFKIQKANDSISAWGNIIEKFRKFRQFRRDKNTGNITNFGKSQWPEPGAIRHLAGRRSRPEVMKFPRGQFGLPIIFHFPQDKGLIPDATLIGKDVERLASPLILRPIQCVDGAVSLALILEAPQTPPKGLMIEGLRKIQAVDAEMLPYEAEYLTKTGLTPLENKTDVLKAFVDFLNN